VTTLGKTKIFSFKSKGCIPLTTVRDERTEQANIFGGGGISLELVKKL
jgi:hypothetical protein